MFSLTFEIAPFNCSFQKVRNIPVINQSVALMNVYANNFPENSKYKIAYSAVL